MWYCGATWNTGGLRAARVKVDSVAGCSLLRVCRLARRRDEGIRRAVVRCCAGGRRVHIVASAAIPDSVPYIMAQTPKLLSQVRGRMRARHMSPRTEQAYVGWIVRYIRYHGTRHPSALDEEHIVAYLTHLAAERRVARSTQMQALSAIQLLYREVLGIKVSDLRSILRSTAPTRCPQCSRARRLACCSPRCRGRRSWWRYCFTARGSAS